MGVSLLQLVWQNVPPRWAGLHPPAGPPPLVPPVVMVGGPLVVVRAPLLVVWARPPPPSLLQVVVGSSSCSVGVAGAGVGVVSVWEQLVGCPSSRLGVVVVVVVKSPEGLVVGTLGDGSSSGWQEESPLAGRGPHQLEPWQSE